jgi:uncharacterized protein YkwD
MTRPKSLLQVLVLLAFSMASGCSSTTRGPVPIAPSEGAPRESAQPNPDREEPKLSAFEQEVLKEMNRLRENPSAYARSLNRLLGHYHGRLLEIPGMVPLETQEGSRALQEALRALRRAKAAPTLQLSDGLTAAARAHVADIGPKGLFGHSGSDGSDTFQRMERFGTWQQVAAENIQYGGRTGEEVVQLLLIDDGVPGRGHRKNLLNPEFRVTGVACGDHSRLRTVCVMTYAAGFDER